MTRQLRPCFFLPLRSTVKCNSCRVVEPQSSTVTPRPHYHIIPNLTESECILTDDIHNLGCAHVNLGLRIVPRMKPPKARFPDSGIDFRLPPCAFRNRSGPSAPVCKRVSADHWLEMMATLTFLDDH